MKDNHPNITSHESKLGAIYSAQETSFRVWAPNAKSVDLLICDGRNRRDSTFRMIIEERGYFSLSLNASNGTNYFYILDGKKRRPDPASRWQPSGVHGASAIVDSSSFRWQDASWRGIPKRDLIIYELHVGTFSRDGKFSSIIPYLEYLKENLGVTAIELMPVGQFPGERNWGYDGVYMYAPQNSYGGPHELRKLVNACHTKGIGVLLDVVYNHLGPEGNYLGDYGPYFSFKYKTPWGPAVNYDDGGCDEVRKFIVQNALHWIDEYHFDGLRLDAIHGIFDFSPKHILLEIAEAVHEESTRLGREIHVISESDLNDPRVISPKAKGGLESDAQWSDDFHHSVHAYLTSERYGIYSDFGALHDILKSLVSSFVYDGTYSNFRKRRHGAPCSEISGDRFVISIQNHDQVGNRPDGARLSRLITLSQLKIAATLMILSRNLPLLFMGEEYAETAPFYYFVNHSDKKLIRAVAEGRKREFESHHWAQEYTDAQSRSTFLKSKINHSLRNKSANNRVFEYYRELILLRKRLTAFQNYARDSISVRESKENETIVMERKGDSDQALVVFVFKDKPVNIPDLVKTGVWNKILDSTTFDRPGAGDFASNSVLDSQNNYSIFPPSSVTVYALQK